MITIINYGMGNLGSIQNMLEYLNINCKISNNIKDIENAEKIILPGVGAFGAAMENLNSNNFVEILKHKVLEHKTPILGICLGMQLLTNGSKETDESKGLGLLDAYCNKFEFDSQEYKVPHMGWNEIITSKSSLLTKDFFLPSKFYFVHSYFVKCNEASNVLAETNFGFKFCSMLEHENIFGAQFHPEKSHKYGMKLFENFNKI